MIRSVQIPTGGNVPPFVPGSLQGCHPGGDCCDDCRSHRPATGPPIGSPSTHVHLMGVRNTSLRASLGQLQCDQDGNCYDNGTLVSAPLTTGSGCQPGQPFCLSSVLPWAAGAGLLLLLFTGGGGRRR